MWWICSDVTGRELPEYARTTDLIGPAEKDGVMDIMNPLVEFGRTQGQIDLPDRLGHLTDTQLNDFAEALLDFQTLADAQTWLARV